MKMDIKRERSKASLIPDLGLRLLSVFKSFACPIINRFGVYGKGGGGGVTGMHMSLCVMWHLHNNIHISASCALLYIHCFET